MYLLDTTLKKFSFFKMMRDEDLSGTIFYMKQSNQFFFMKWKQGSCTIYDKIYLHHRLMPCILSKSADPKLIWGYYLDRFSPDKTIVLSQKLKARKHRVLFCFFIYSLFFGFMLSCLLISDLHHNWRTVLDSFPLFSSYIIDMVPSFYMLLKLKLKSI